MYIIKLQKFAKVQADGTHVHGTVLESSCGYLISKND